MPGVLRAFDIHEAIGLLAPMKIALVTHGHKRCMWSGKAYDRLGCSENLMLAADVRSAVKMVLAE
ncbi:MAG: hypothetical protein ACYTFY_17710 [Planctomycetota bacterium]|jgi:hypothetical protein